MDPPRNPSEAEQIMRYRYTVEQSSDMKKDKCLSFAAKWMRLEDIAPNKPDTERQLLHVLGHTEKAKICYD